MMVKAANWSIGFGVAFFLLGLCVLAAGLSDPSETAISGLGLLMFSFGGVGVGLGMYLKARSMQSAPVSSPEPQAIRRAAGGCDLCGVETPAVHCRVHQLHLCGPCLAKHYDVRSCVYVPSQRRAPAKGAVKVKATAAAVRV